MMIKKILFIAIIFSGLCASNSNVHSVETIRVLTWEGYVLPEEVREVNNILKKEEYPYRVDVISPYAEGAEQMFKLIREEKCDIMFLTIFFIKMQGEKTSKLLMPINLNSPRLTNYKYLLPGLKEIPMGLDRNHRPLYIPWGGGTYGFYADTKRVKPSKIPRSVSDLWDRKWKGKISLNIAQPWYNIGLVLMSFGKNPFYINQLLLLGKRRGAISLCDSEGEIQRKTNDLYRQAGHFWKNASEFREELVIVSSWGPEIMEENASGAAWKFIEFREGNMLWLDTINFRSGLPQRKLEAAEIFANYFIGREVQTRVAKGLAMVAASSLAESNPMVEANPKFFLQDMFVPPYTKIADNLMQMVSDRALQAAGAR
ncbi:MAG: extracellular solute-binding protein [Desulfobacteraceae bacterium]|nr:extracellular solute-binding protein [Desulfobacteraceae bacterium]